MKIKTTKKELRNAIDSLMPVLPKRKSKFDAVPVLSGILIEAGTNVADHVYMTAANVDENRVRVKLEAEIEDCGVCWLDALRFKPAVWSALGHDITITASDWKTTTVSDGNTTLSLLAFDPWDYPESKETKDQMILGCEFGELCSLLKRFTPAVSLDDCRKALHGVCVEVDRHYYHRIAATDGKRLHYLNDAQNEQFNPEEIEHRFILSLDIIKILLKAKIPKDRNIKLTVNYPEQFTLDDSKKLTDRKYRCKLECGDDYILSGKCIWGNYPNYYQVIPGSFEHVVKFPVSTLRQTINCIYRIMGDGNWVKISGDVNGKVCFSAQSNMIGEVSRTIEVDSDESIPEYSFNAQFILDAIGPKRKGEEDIVFQYNDKWSPVRFQNDNVDIVIMPMR